MSKLKRAKQLIGKSFNYWEFVDLPIDVAKSFETSYADLEIIVIDILTLDENQLIIYNKDLIIDNLLIGNLLPKLTFRQTDFKNIRNNDLKENEKFIGSTVKRGIYFVYKLRDDLKLIKVSSRNRYFAKFLKTKSKGPILG